MKLIELYAEYDNKYLDDEIRDEGDKVPPSKSFLNYQKAGSGIDAEKSPSKVQSKNKARVNQQQFKNHKVSSTDDNIDNLDVAANGVTDAMLFNPNTEQLTPRKK